MKPTATFTKGGSSTHLLWIGVLVAALVALATSPPAVSAAAVPASASPKWDARRQGAFIVSLAQDQQGRIWVGTEDAGVWRFDPLAPDKKQWTSFTTKDGLGDDNAYAIAADKQGRIWVGTLNHGVSVFNGQTWRAYGMMEGLSGDRVFSIAVNPINGDVWLATNAGLTRYLTKQDSWVSYGRNAVAPANGSGLPSNQANALAFDSVGNLYAATQCDGVAIGSAADDYKSWRVVRGPEKAPNAPAGEGLPSSLINDVLVSGDDVVYVATNAGLARSSDDGETWSYLRGMDWEAKVKGLYKGPEPQQPREHLNRELLREDYVTSLAEDAQGLLWIGYRQKGYEIRRPHSDRVPYVSAKQPSDTFPYVSSILPRRGIPPLLANYGEGLNEGVPVPWFAPSNAELQQLEEGSNWKMMPTPAATSGAVPALPSPAKLATLADLTTLLGELKAAPTRPGDGITPIIALDDDWSTQGNWIDRYGNFATILCNMGGGGSDLNGGYRAAYFDYRAWTGRNHKSDDFLRYWVHWIRTDNPRSLQNPNLGGRKQSEWDDHGEAYPMSMDGPHVYCTVKVPKGDYFLSLYFFNKDGHTAMNRARDYLAEVRRTPMEDKRFHLLGWHGNQAEADFEQAAPGAASRVRDFWGGVYKRFLLRGGGEYFTIRVNRNYSFNTIISAIFLDPAGELCGPQGPEAQPAQLRQLLYADATDPPRIVTGTCLQMMDRLLYLREANPTWYALNSRRYVLPLLRRLLNREETGNRLVLEIEQSGQHGNLRQDIAACLDDVQMFDRRDRVFFSPRNYQSYVWATVTGLGQNANWDLSRYMNSWQWDYVKLHSFIHEQQAKQTW